MAKSDAIRDVEDMPVYGLFYDLALRVEKTSRAFSHDFRWLRIQMLRSSESVCANMTEGFYSQYSTEYLQCLYRCRREARETMKHVSYATDVGQLPVDIGDVLVKDYEKALHQHAALIASIERKMQRFGKGKANGMTVKEFHSAYTASAFESPQEPSAIDH